MLMSYKPDKIIYCIKGQKYGNDVATFCCNLMMSLVSMMAECGTSQAA